MGYFSELHIVGQERGNEGMRTKVYEDLRKSGQSHAQALRGADTIVPRAPKGRSHTSWSG